MSWWEFVRDAASVEADRVKAGAAAAVRRLVLVFVAAMVLLMGVVFALVGAYASLSEQLPPWQAGGLIGLGALVVCGLMLLAAKGRRRPPPRERRRSRRSVGPDADDLEASAELGAAASNAARDFVREHRPTGLELTLAAFVVGLVASRGSRRRRRDSD